MVIFKHPKPRLFTHELYKTSEEYCLQIISIACYAYALNKQLYVTGFWKTNQIVTLGLLDFIDPTNGYTHTLHIHSAIIRLG